MKQHLEKARNERMGLAATEENELSVAEKSRLQQLEEIIEQDIEGFSRVGNALIEINESRLYRLTHSTFEAYMKDRWDISKSNGYELMRSAKCIDGLVIQQTGNCEDGKIRAQLRTLQRQEVRCELCFDATRLRFLPCGLQR